ncbi:GH24307 [Drosophila grimshawi]|uniref:GH24307 n=1 Tax=Drosophila grimshawi TaxID=7222 RepID=B4JML0_DROGR|nr:GH24307 [Drosophila grimshawi]
MEERHPNRALPLELELKPESKLRLRLRMINKSSGIQSKLGHFSNNMDNASELKRKREFDISDNEEYEEENTAKVAKKNVFNGSIIFIEGRDFVVIASDNRLITKLDILRKHFKLFPMTPQSIIGSIGNWGDVVAMTALIRRRVQVYEQDNKKTISTEALASMISTLMYNRRLFPCLMITILAGLDNEGKGAVFHFDEIGNRERCRYLIIGGARDIMLAKLRHSIGEIDSGIIPSDQYQQLTKERAFGIARDCFIHASHLRADIGNTVMIKTIYTKGSQETILKLR